MTSVTLRRPDAATAAAPVVNAAPPAAPPVESPAAPEPIDTVVAYQPSPEIQQLFAGARRLNETERVTAKILDHLEGITTAADSKAIADQLTALPPREQAEVLRGLMADYQRCGEGTPENMLYFLFEDLAEEDRQRVATSLRDNGVLPPEAIDALLAGRSTGAKLFPVTTQKGIEAAEYWADVSVHSNHPLSPLANVPGWLASLWLPETAGGTAMMVATAGLGAGLAAAPEAAAAAGLSARVVTLARGANHAMLGFGTFTGAYGAGIAAQEAISGNDVFTGKPLSAEDRIARLVLTGCGIILVGTSAYALRPQDGGGGGRLQLRKLSPEELASLKEDFVELRIEGAEPGVSMLVPKSLTKALPPASPKTQEALAKVAASHGEQKIDPAARSYQFNGTNKVEEGLRAEGAVVKKSPDPETGLRRLTAAVGDERPIEIAERPSPFPAKQEVTVDMKDPGVVKLLDRYSITNVSARAWVEQRLRAELSKNPDAGLAGPLRTVNSEIASVARSKGGIDVEGRLGRIYEKGIVQTGSKPEHLQLADELQNLGILKTKSWSSARADGDFQGTVAEELAMKQIIDSAPPGSLVLRNVNFKGNLYTDESLSTVGKIDKSGNPARNTDVTPELDALIVKPDASGKFVVEKVVNVKSNVDRAGARDQNESAVRAIEGHAEGRAIELGHADKPFGVVDRVTAIDARTGKPVELTGRLELPKGPIAQEVIVADEAGLGMKTADIKATARILRERQARGEATKKGPKS